MTQNFSTLSIILARCGEKIANQALEEIKAAVKQAVAQASTPAEVDTAFAPLSTTITTAKATRAAKAAARRAAKKAQKPTLPTEAKIAKEANMATQAIQATEQPAAAPDSYLTPAMVQYLRHCPDDYLLQVLNTYIHLLRTGNLIFPADDCRYINNFLLLARSAGIIAHPDAPITQDEITNYFFNNPALPIPRAQRRALERARRRALRHSQK